VSNGKVLSHVECRLRETSSSRVLVAAAIGARES